MGDHLLNFWEWLQNAAQQAAIVEAPAVMTAAGHKIDRSTKKVQYNHANDKDVKQLRSNLAAIGEAGINAPGAAKALELGYNIVRHPKQSYRAAKTILKNVTRRKQKDISKTDVDDLMPYNIQKLKTTDDFVLEQVPQNRQDALDYITDKRRKTAFDQVLEDAMNSGYISDKSVFNGPTVNTIHPRVIIEDLGFGTGGNYTKGTHTVKINPYHSTDIANSIYHEHLHAGGVADINDFDVLDNLIYQQAMDDIIYGRNIENAKQVVENLQKQYTGLYKYYTDQAAKVLKRNPSAYISYPKETAANAMEYGRSIGIKPFQQQPSNQEILNMIVNKDQSYNQFAAEMITPKTNEDFTNIWKAMNGTLLPSSIAVPILYNTYDR